jgi:integrase
LYILIVSFIKENLFLWNSLYKDVQIVKRPIVSLTAQDFSIFFRIMTKDGNMTSKRFNDGKSVLNSIYDYAMEIGLVPLNPIKSVSCNKLNFKPVNNNLDVYTLEERKKLLDLLSTKKNDIYSLAIQLNFNLIARIGELKDFMWSDIGDKHIRIQGQLLEEQTMNDDLSFNTRTYNHVDYVKGRTSDGFRNIPLTPKARDIIEKIKELNPDGEFMLMCDGKPLTTVTFNRYLKAFCKEAGITYRSSHKIRFCVASAMYAKGVAATKLQKLLGHSTLAMTLKYFKDITPENDCYESMVDILDY